MKKVLLILILLVVGCNEAQKLPESAPQIKPLTAHIFPASQNWKDTYGDTLETQLVFNAAVSGRDDVVLQNVILQIAGVIRNAHVGDPNEVIWRESVEVRLDLLTQIVLLKLDKEKETSKIYEEEHGITTEIEKFDESWPSDSGPNWWRPEVRDVRRKINEIIEVVNNQN